MNDRSYRGHRIYRSELGESDSVFDILPDTLTLYPQLHPAIWRESPDSELKTIFHEVDIVPFDEANPHAEEQLKPLDAIEPEVVTEEHYANIMWDTLRDSIHEMWEPGRIHYLFTSSGYDSRLIAYAVWKLYEEHGRDWLGETYFVEADGESKQFKRSMQMIGWKPDQLIVYNENASTHKYHANSFDFSTAWNKLGGMCGCPLNFRWEAEVWMQQHGLMPEDEAAIQTIAGYFSNEIVTTMLKKLTLYEYFKLTYRRALSTPRHWMGSTQSPFQHFDMIVNQLKYGTEHLKPRTGIAQLILRHFAPPELADLPSPKHREKLTTSRLIADRLLARAITNYQGSWFGQQFPDVEPIQQIKYDPWWAHWCVASFCEHLIREGYTISIA